MASAADHEPDPNRKGPPAEPRPSAAVLLISPQNQVLLLQRVIRDKDHFSGGHVFPGGNVSKQDGTVPQPGQPDRHEDSKVYRLAACRETFEESGILLAKKDGKLLELPEHVREEARRKIHDNKMNFSEWIKSLGGECDTDGLRPFTRWITPPSVPRRFTTQMYVYMLPIGESTLADQGDYFIPRADGGREHNSASFKHAEDWIELGQTDKIVIFPPQFYQLSLVAPFIKKGGDLRKQREQLTHFLETLPENDKIPWSKKIISPDVITTKNGKRILLLDTSGPELNFKKQGDLTRVVMMSQGRKGIALTNRQDVEEEILGRNKL